MADRRLQVFATVAKLLSFTKAAEALHMTQPAVTFQIRQLEEYFNTRLFDRTHNRISLTEAGDLVFGYATQILQHSAEMDNAVRKLTGSVAGPLVVGASTTIGEYSIPGLMGRFQAAFPDVSLRLLVANTESIVHMVEDNEIDVGVVEGPVNNKNLASKICWNDELVCVCPADHELAGMENITLEQLTGYPLIFREEGSGTRAEIMKYVEQQGHSIKDLNIIMEFGSPESIKSAVEANLGLSILSKVTVTKEQELRLLATVSLSPELVRPFSLVYQRQKFRVRAMEEFMKFIHTEIDTPSSTEV
jgi:DNA-binding transcriptional LysR family regulator